MSSHRAAHEELEEVRRTATGSNATDSAGQSGYNQALSSVAEAADESVEELAETGQAYEAGIIAGVEDAGDHPDRPVHTHEDGSINPFQSQADDDAFGE